MQSFIVEEWLFSHNCCTEIIMNSVGDIKGKE